MTQTSENPKVDLTYSLITHGIRITACPQHLDENSDPTNNIFSFAYTITIENLSDKKVQLLERHWVILSAGVQIAEVVGPGVVGEQPELDAGQTFEYTSGAVINDPVGAMHGSYTFESEDGKIIEVTIPRFDLLYPMVLH